MRTLMMDEIPICRTDDLPAECQGALKLRAERLRHPRRDSAGRVYERDADVREENPRLMLLMATKQAVEREAGPSAGVIKSQSAKMTGPQDSISAPQNGSSHFSVVSGPSTEN